MPLAAETHSVTLHAPRNRSVTFGALAGGDASSRREFGHQSLSLSYEERQRVVPVERIFSSDVGCGAVPSVPVNAEERNVSVRSSNK